MELNFSSRRHLLWLAVAAYLVRRSTPSIHVAAATIRVDSVSSTGSASALSSTLLDISDVENTTPVAEELARTGEGDTARYQESLTISSGNSDGEVVVTARADSGEAAIDLANAAAFAWVKIFNDGEAAQDTVLFEALVEEEAR